MVFSQL